MQQQVVVREAALGVERAPVFERSLDQFAERGPSGRQRAVGRELFEATLFGRIAEALGKRAQKEAQLTF